jgi:hypothetical protein
MVHGAGRLLFVMAVVSCGRFGFGDGAAGGDGGPPGDGAPPGDGDPPGDDGPPGDDAPTAACSSRYPDEGYAAGTEVCGAWGLTTMNGYALAVTNDALELTPTAMGGNNFGGCTILSIDLTIGVFIRVERTLTGQEGYTNIVAGFPSPTTVGLQHNASNGTLRLVIDGSTTAVTVPYDEVGESMRYWGLFAEAGRVYARYSADAITWTDLGSRDDAGGDVTAGKVTFGAGNFGPTVGGVARFDDFNRCPPP